MSVKLVSATCPNCAANLEVPNDRKIVYCTHCGSQVIVDDGSYTVTHHNIDEAKVIAAKAAGERKLERQRASEKRKNILLRVGIALVVLLAIIGISDIFTGKGALAGILGFAVFIALIGAAIYIGVLNAKAAATPLEDDELRIPLSSASAKSRKYTDVKTQLESSGFRKVSAVPLHDLGLFSSKKDGLVAEMTVAGVSDVEEGTIVYIDAPIVIRYHSK